MFFVIIITQCFYNRFPYFSLIRGKNMEGHFLRKELIVCVLFFCLVGSILPSLASITDDQARSIDTKTLLVPASESTTSVSLCVFTRTGPVKQDIIVSSHQATELYQLLLHLEKEGSAHPFSAKTRQLKQEFITALHATTSVSHEIIRAAKAVTPPAWTTIHPKVSFCEKTRSAHLINTTNITRYLCSVGSQGIGSELPPIMIPRPRIVCMWAGFSDSATSVISFWPFGAATITGYQVGLAAGFIGIGAGFAFPSSPAYALYGYALIIRVSGEHIEEFP
jgi:hypothetical protein